MKIPKIPREQIEEMAMVMQKHQEEKESKTQFVKDLAHEIVLKMVEIGYTPKPKVRDYIG